MLTRPLENVLLRKAAASVNGKDPQPLVDSILNHIQLVIITKHKGVDVLVVPKLFKPLTEDEKKALSQEELALRGKADEDERNVFMEAGGHDSRKLDSSMIESGSRMDPIAAKEALLNFATPQQLLESSKLTSVKLATKGTQNFTVCKDINDFLKTATFQKFRQLSTEKDAPPYQKFYPEATADLLAGLAQVSKDQGGLDKVFENKQITEVLQHAYYRMLNAMAGAATYKGNLIEFMNNIELIHDQLQMILAVAEPHAPETTFSEGIVKALRENTGKDDKPTLPQEISDPLVSHKASAMHSVASVLSSVEDQKEKAEGVRKLTALVLKDNYYEAHGAVENSKTYDVSVLDGWKLKDANGADQALTDQAFENGKKPAGPIDVFICDFHHNISVERSEYKVENLEHQVEELFKNGLVADKFTVAIDCTVDYIRSEDIKKFLEKHKNRITDGKMNVVLYRSAQKFDMLGMDNYYGGYTVTINDGKSYQAFNDRINKKEDQATGLSHQGMAHLVKFGSKHQDDYRTAIMENTKKLYDGLPARCRGDEKSPLMIAKTEDPRNAFLDIQFPGRSELFAVGNTMPGKGPILEGFYVHFIKWAQGQNLAFTTRPSFGFSTTNFTLIAGSKVRLNPGLESEEALNKYIGYFTKVLQLLEDSEQAALAKQPKDTFASAKALTDFLDKVSDDALKTWNVPPIPTRNLGTGSPRNITGPETAQFNSNSGKVKTGQTPVATEGQAKSKKKTGGQSNDIPLPPQHPVVYGDLSNPNPFLYFEPNKNGGNNLRVDSVNPRGKWAALDQFCAYLATHWLTTGHNEGGLKFKDLDLSTRQKAVQTLYDWGGTGGLAAQEQYAIQKLTAQKITKNNVIQNAQNGTYNAGTKIWFGTDIHTQAAVVLANGTYNVYDPNTGLVKNMTGTAFATYANSSNVFIVA